MNKREKIKNIIHKLANISYAFSVVFLVFIAGLTALSVLKVPNGIKIFSVKSGSMSPAVPLGSIVVIKPQDQYKVSDIITYKSENERNIENPKLSTTHRIVEVQDKEGKLFYLTKGDANEAPDGLPVDSKLVLGKVLFYIPVIGYLISITKTVTGLIILIVIPATIIVYSEIITIKKEITKRYEKRKQKSEKKDEDK